MSVKLVPFDEDGNLTHYPQPAHWGGKLEWRENLPFTATLTFKEFRRGRSAAYAMWQDTKGRSYPMFLTDLESLLTSDRPITQASASGEWIVRKRGKNYGVGIA
jgi:hypothetical protein